MGLEIFVDGAAVQVSESSNLLQACLAAGHNIPYFCWHPALGSVGACRQCAVKLFAGPDDKTSKIVMSCMTQPAAGMRVGVQEPEAVAAREAVVEFVLANHPHDCPVCEVGGECHLQDMTAMTGHSARRARHAKRTHRSQDLGPFIRHEMNRCIGCYRCVRFYQDYAGGTDFGVFGAAKNVFFGRAEDGALESPFAGNLIEVCPTGVFVDKPFSKTFRRKWDMRATPSICPHCAVGCNITLNERDGAVRRVVNRHNATLNGYFLCDRGRFGAGFLQSDRRLRVSRDRSGNIVSREAAVAHLARVLAKTDAIGVGSPRASIESNFLMWKLFSGKKFYAGVTKHDSAAMAASIAAMQAVPIATLAAVENADAVLVLGQDPILAAPRLGLALRQAASRAPASLLAAREIPAWHDAAARTAAFGSRTPFIIAGPDATGLDDVASAIYRLSPDETVALALSMAAAPAASTNILSASRRPLVVAGGSAALIAAGAGLVASLRKAGLDARLSLMLPAANSIGLGCFGARSIEDYDLAGVTAIALETDAPALANAAGVTCLDHIQTAAARQADIAVAVASFADAAGTFVNSEGRVQAFHKAVYGTNDPPAAWEILRDAGIAAGRLPPGIWPNHQALIADIATSMPHMAPIAAVWRGDATARPPSLPHRHSGRNAAQTHTNIRDEDAAFTTSMEGSVQTGAAPLVWAPGWNSGQAALQRRPDDQDEVFLFRADVASEIHMPQKPWTYQPSDGTEEMSALSPAIIARSRA
jgi:NADH-quinone oxidoreductase subunit G